jgi:ABC-type phosphate transport system substrate-binding protein
VNLKKNRVARTESWDTTGILSGGIVMKIVFGIAAVLVIMLASFAAPSIVQADDTEYVIVANKLVQGTSINIAALKGIYLREIRNWANSDGQIVPVDLANSNSFYQNLFGKSYAQMQAYWLNMRIKYSVDLPVAKKDPESVKQFIASNKGAIGFLKNSDLDDRVKVLKIIN